MATLPPDRRRSCAPRRGRMPGPPRGPAPRSTKRVRIRMNTYRELAPVFFGSINEAKVICSVLDAHGYESFISDENIEVTDPIITGANSFDVRLLVPASDAKAVAALIEGLRENRIEEPPSPAVRRGWRLLALFPDADCESSGQSHDKACGSKETATTVNRDNGCGQELSGPTTDEDQSCAWRGLLMTRESEGVLALNRGCGGTGGRSPAARGVPGGDWGFPTGLIRGPKARFVQCGQTPPPTCASWRSAADSVWQWSPPLKSLEDPRYEVLAGVSTRHRDPDPPHGHLHPGSDPRSFVRIVPHWAFAIPRRRPDPRCGGVLIRGAEAGAEKELPAEDGERQVAVLAVVTVEEASFSGTCSAVSSRRLGVLFPASAFPRSRSRRRSLPFGSRLPTRAASNGSTRRSSWSLRSSWPRQRP